MSKTNIEACHIYFGEQGFDENEILESISIVKETLGSLSEDGYTLNVLIDDYFMKPDAQDITYLVNTLNESGIMPTGIYYESDLKTVAHVFIEELKQHRLKRTSEDVFFSNVSNDSSLYRSLERDSMKSSFLDGDSFDDCEDEKVSVNRVQKYSMTTISQISNGNVRYSCPLLAACWNLARLGYEPYVSALTTFKDEEQKKEFSSSKLVTLLPTTFIAVEATVVDLLKSLKPKKYKGIEKSLSYTFH